jgi:hypothetical protein
MNPTTTCTGAVPVPMLLFPDSGSWLSSRTIVPDGAHLTRILEQPPVFISACGAAYERDELISHRVGVVVSLTPQIFETVDHCNPDAAGIERYRVLSRSPFIGAVYSELGVHRYLLPLKNDGSASPDEIIAAYTLVKQLCKQSSGGGILVHCQSGNSQSVGVVGALIAKAKQWSLERAVREVARFRAVSLDEGFARGIAVAIGVPFEEK